MEEQSAANNPQENHEVTRLLQVWDGGDPKALEALMPLIFEDLQRIARSRFSGEKASHTLQPTALVNELYMKLMGESGRGWKSRAQFFAAAADRMRQILIDHARKKNASKRGGDRTLIPLDAMGEENAGGGNNTVDLLALNEALTRLEAYDARMARVVTLRYFAGLSVEETAHVLDISPRTAKREWSMAKTMLRQELDAMGGS